MILIAVASVIALAAGAVIGAKNPTKILAAVAAVKANLTRKPTPKATAPKSNG